MLWQGKPQLCLGFGDGQYHFIININYSYIFKKECLINTNKHGINPCKIIWYNEITTDFFLSEFKYV